MSGRIVADRPADVTVSAPEPLGGGYLDYRRYHLTLHDAGGSAATQTRDIALIGKVAAVLPVDLARDEIVLIRQFRLPAHLANGRGDMIEIVAGRVEDGETVADTAHRECAEEIGVAPRRLVELFSYLTTPGIVVEEVTVFLAAVDAAAVPARTGLETESERIETLRVPIDDALAAMRQGSVRNGPLIVALQWLALNRARLGALLDVKR